MPFNSYLVEYTNWNSTFTSLFRKSTSLFFLVKHLLLARCKRVVVRQMLSWDRALFPVSYVAHNKHLLFNEQIFSFPQTLKAEICMIISLTFLDIFFLVTHSKWFFFFHSGICLRGEQRMAERWHAAMPTRKWWCSHQTPFGITTTPKEMQ